MSKRASLVLLIALCLAAGPVGCGDDDDDDSEGGDGDSGDGDSGDGDTGDGDTGDGDTDNVGACNNWKSAVSCDGADTSALDALDCSTYENVACDISAYFDCLSDNTKCNGGQLDLSGWSSCANLAMCM